ncbi:LPS translocon maturation chaperone LptM [Sphaerotilus sulfidivorans]|uniref:LPS translocon maturation chaperone LptM n=1 Tax=Sphaerotilus sulfidivorans TaxID=639200 RepID=UPI003B5B525F
MGQAKVLGIGEAGGRAVGGGVRSGHGGQARIVFMLQGLLKTSVALACTVLLATGCGQKGPLTLPREAAVTPAPAPAPASGPVPPAAR